MAQASAGVDDTRRNERRKIESQTDKRNVRSGCRTIDGQKNSDWESEDISNINKPVHACYAFVRIQWLCTHWCDLHF
jgi:hypothetical protein